MSEHQDNDDPRDAHLLAALRHAPDRDAVPPREVSERILAAAHAAVRPTRAATAPWGQRLSAWLMRPQVAASFGTLAVASLVGVMWSTREPPIGEPASPKAVAERALPPAATEPSVSGLAVAVQSAAPSAPERDLLAQTSPSTPPPKQEAAPARAKEAKARPELRQRAEVLAEKPAPPVADKAALPPAAAPAPPAADAPVATASAAERRSNAAADSLRMARRETNAPDTGPAAAPAAGALNLAPRAHSAADALAQADALLGTAAGGWSSGGRAWPHAAAQAAWWVQFRRETGSSTWQRISPSPERASPPWLTLVTQGKAHTSIELAADAVLVCTIDPGACWRAPITAAQREAWIAEVARW